MDAIRKMTKMSLEESNDAMLRSRIEQQSDLICILKRRADEYLEKSMKYEDEIKNLKEDCEKLTELYTIEKKKFTIKSFAFEELDKLCKSLQAEHAQLKTEHGDLKQKHDILHVEHENLLTIRNEMQENTFKQLNNDINQKKEEIKELNNQLKLNEKNYKKSMADLQAKSDSSASKLKSELKSTADELHKVKEKLLSTSSLHTAAETNDKSNKKQLRRLQADLQNAKSELEKANAQYCEEKNKSSDLQAQITNLLSNPNKPNERKSLQLRIFELEQEQKEQEIQFEAYKKYANEVLMKERELNSQLRRVRSQRPSSMNINNKSQNS